MLARRRNHPGTAAVLSCVFTGLGQIYNGQLPKGFMLLAVSMAALLVVIVSAVLIGHWLMGSDAITPAVLAGSIVCFILSVSVIAVSGIYSITDAFRTAQRR